MANVASFSSRGMTTWNLLEGIGMIKPDIVTAGTGVIGIGIGDSPDGVSCTLNSGTSVSAGIITASIALALSAQSQDIENASFPIKHNTVSVKQALAKSAKRLKSLSITE